jgi:hypothetical protein
VASNLKTSSFSDKQSCSEVVNPSHQSEIIMGTDKKKDVKNDLIDVENENDTVRNEENIEKNSSSKVTTTFQKNHGRTNPPLGDGHEPGTIPGTGV